MTSLPGGQIPPALPPCRHCSHPASHHSANQCWTNPDGTESQEVTCEHCPIGYEPPDALAITECEGHRALIDAVLAEREAELAVTAIGNNAGWVATGEALRRAWAAREHRQAVVDSIGGAVVLDA